MSANDRQVDGNHYSKRAIQPWDYIVANDIPYLEGCAIKYLTRWRDKGGLVDLRKALHFIEKLIEIETAALESTKDLIDELEKTHRGLAKYPPNQFGKTCPHGVPVGVSCEPCTAIQRRKLDQSHDRT